MQYPYITCTIHKAINIGMLAFVYVYLRVNFFFFESCSVKTVHHVEPTFDVLVDLKIYGLKLLEMHLSIVKLNKLDKCCYAIHYSVLHYYHWKLCTHHSY